MGPGHAGDAVTDRPKKRYLGDGVYAMWDGFMVRITTENGFTTTNTVYFEPEVVDALLEYISVVRDYVRTVRESGDGREGKPR